MERKRSLRYASAGDKITHKMVTRIDERREEERTVAPIMKKMEQLFRGGKPLDKQGKKEYDECARTLKRYGLYKLFQEAFETGSISLLGATLEEAGKLVKEPKEADKPEEGALILQYPVKPKRGRPKKKKQ